MQPEAETRRSNTRIGWRSITSSVSLLQHYHSRLKTFPARSALRADRACL
jgi:hypothetical protein